MKKIEKKIRQYFHQREIQPSENAWERMEMLIEQKRPKKRKSISYLLPVAASILLLMGLWFTLKNPEEKLMETNVKPVVIKNTPQQIAVPKNCNHQVVVNQPVVQKSKNTVQKIIQEHPKEAEQYVEAQEKVPIKTIEKSLAEQTNDIITNNTVNQLVDNKELTKIHVNPEKLLQSAEIERQIENTYTDGQNFWRKIKELNASVNPIEK